MPPLVATPRLPRLSLPVRSHCFANSFELAHGSTARLMHGSVKGQRDDFFELLAAEDITQLA